MVSRTNTSRQPSNSDASSQSGKYTVLFNQWNPHFAERPSRGFPNPEFLCYRNAAMTSLLHIPVFLNWLELHRQGCSTGGTKSRRSKESDCLICQFALLAAEYWSEGEETKNLFRLMDNFWWTCTMFGWEDGGKQHDVEEFLSNMTEQLKTAGQHMDNSLQHIFEGVVTERTTCGSCSYTHDTPERHILAATRPKPTTGRTKWALEKGIRSVAVRTTRHPCPSCNMPLKSRRINIREAPEVLIVKINRATMRNGELIKTIDKVDFGETLDLTEYRESEAVDGGQSLEYQLVAVTSHAGDSTVDGHYISFVKSPDATWTRLNDLDSEMVTFDQVKSHRQNRNADHIFTPYLLIYQRMPAQPPVTPSVASAPNASGGSNLQVPEESAGVGPVANTNTPLVATPANNDQPDSQATQGAAAQSSDVKAIEAAATTNHPKQITAYPSSGFRWEGQPGEIMVQVTMGDVVLKGVLKGVLRTTCKRPGPDDEVDDTQHSSKRPRVSPVNVDL